MQEETAKNNPPPARAWVAILAATALLLLVFLIVLPLGMAYGLQSWLLDNGGEEVRLEDIDFNIFNGKAAIKNLVVHAGGQQQLVIPRVEVDIDWLPLFSQQVAIRTILVEGVELSVEQSADGRLVIGGIRLPEIENTPDEPAGDPWGFGLDEMEVANISIDFQSPDLQLDIHLDDLRLGLLTTWATDPARLSLDGTLNGARVQLDGQLPPLSSGVGYAGTLTLSALPLQTFATLVQPAVKGLAGTLTLDTRLDVLQANGESLTVSQTGVIAVTGLALEQDGQTITYGQLQWDGKTNVSALSDETQLTLKGELTGEDLVVAIPAETLQIRQGSFLWSGELRVASSAATRVQASGHLAVRQLDIVGDDRKISLVNVGGIEAGQLSLAENSDLTVTDLQLTDAVFASDVDVEGVGKGEAVLTAAAVSIDSLQLTDSNQLAIGVMEWRDVVSQLRRNAAGKWQVVRIIDTLPFAGKASGEERQAGGAVAKTGAPAGRVRVGELKITGDSAIVLDDASVQPPVTINLRIDEATITDLDSGTPDQDSAVLVKGGIGKHSSLLIKGMLQPFTAQPTLNLNIQLDGLALTQLSPYTVSSLGYALKSGQLDTKSTLKIRQGKIESGNRLVIRALEVNPADNKSREQLDSQLAVPLGTALNMLRDKHDTIKLDLPVGGDLDSPDFDISDVVNTAVSKALKKGTMTYLTLALQPYGALITVAKLANEAASKVRLKPVGFEPGTVTSLADTDDYLEKVAAILKDRAEVNIKVCGFAVTADRVALAGGEPTGAGAEGETNRKDKSVETTAKAGAITEGQLMELAQQRARFVKDHLVIKFGVTHTRLVACQPEVETGGETLVPRVDLLI